jgi:peptidoglycan/xylan/chitin deacetylase (PgdA/CDA1 family)
MKKVIIFVGLGISVIFLFLIGSYKLMNARTYQVFGKLTSQVHTDQKVVALTFDDGPTKNVDKILPLLEQYKAKGTFFLIGNEIEKNPAEAQKLVKAGEQIGNHTFSHQRMVLKSPTFIKEEIEKTDQLIRQAGYKGEIDFRPPNGKKLIGLPFYLSQHNRETIMWNLEPDTYYTSAADKINYVKRNVKPGSIILIHAMYDNNGEELKAITGILQTLSKEGYKFINVNDLQKLQK